MRIRQLVLAAMLATSFVVATSPPAGACSCMGSPANELAELSDVGFIGTLVSVTGERDAIWDFDVESWIHGDETSATIQIDAPRDGAACGFELAVGERVAVYASKRPTGVWSGGLCSTFTVGDALTSLNEVARATDPEATHPLRSPDPITTAELDARAQPPDDDSSTLVLVTIGGVAVLGLAAVATAGIRRRG